MDSSEGPITYRAEGDVAVVSFDDGKVNALTHVALGQLEEALDRAEAEAAALLVVGRDGKFSAGFDLSVMTAGPTQARELLERGARLGLRLFEYPLPVVLGVTGHALAMGGILLCCADVRIAAAGPYKIGLNEVRIGMPVPRFAVELCRSRLTPPAFTQAMHLATIHDPDSALTAGFVDEVVPMADVADRSLEVAAELAGALAEDLAEFNVEG
jgi:enoyl-CoA hydratase